MPFDGIQDGKDARQGAVVKNIVICSADRNFGSGIIRYALPSASRSSAAPPLKVGRIDPAVCCADGLAGFVLGLRDKLLSIYTELEVSFVLLRCLLGVKTADEKQAEVEKLSKAEILMVNNGSTATGAKIMNVKKDAAKIQLTSPACTEIGEKIALSRTLAPCRN